MLIQFFWIELKLPQAYQWLTIIQNSYSVSQVIIIIISDLTEKRKNQMNRISFPQTPEGIMQQTKNVQLHLLLQYLLFWESGEKKSKVSHLCSNWQSFYLVFLPSPSFVKVSFPFSPLSSLLHCIYSSIFPSNSLSPVLSSSSWCVFRFCCCDTKPHHCHTHTLHHLRKPYM